MTKKDIDDKYNVIKTRILSKIENLLEENSSKSEIAERVKKNNDKIDIEFYINNLHKITESEKIEQEIREWKR